MGRLDEMINKKKQEDEVKFKEKIYARMINMALDNLTNNTCRIYGFESLDVSTFQNVSDEYLRIGEAVKSYRNREYTPLSWLIDEYFDEAYDYVSAKREEIVRGHKGILEDVEDPFKEI